jgi:hypothetical protein
MPGQSATFTVVPASEADAPRMGRMMVETWLAAHRDEIPEGQYQRRVSEWTPEVSANAWARALRGIGTCTAPRMFLHLAVGDSYEETASALLAD